MKQGTLIRYKLKSGDFGTCGHMAVGNLSLVSGELPWRDDAKDLSCLRPGPDEPEKTFLLRLLYSPVHGRKVYHFVAMKQDDGTWGPIPDGRTVAEVHSANLFGDILKNFAAQLEGCVALGRMFATFCKGAEFMSFTKDSPEKLVLISLAQDQVGVAESKDAVIAFEAELAGEDCELTVCWV